MSPLVTESRYSSPLLSSAKLDRPSTLNGSVRTFVARPLTTFRLQIVPLR